MDKNLKYLKLVTIDKYLSGNIFCDKPKSGWVKAIRTSISMSARQLATRLNISQQSVAKLEINEINDNITLHSLRKIAEALDCNLCYAIVPKDGTIESMVKKQAYKKALELLQDVDKTMQLENQAVGYKEEKVKELAEDLVKNLNSNLWE